MLIQFLKTLCLLFLHCFCNQGIIENTYIYMKNIFLCWDLNYVFILYIVLHSIITLKHNYFLTHNNHG